MKLVINKCYGGFSLSAKAISRLAELRGQRAYFFVGGLCGRPRTQVPMEEASGEFWIAYNTPTPTPHPTAAEWAAMTPEERQAHNEKTETIDDCSAEAQRGDPLLIQVVEELGDEASGFCAKLSVVEIPDGVEWEIDLYDGQETIREKHRSWR